MPTVPGVYYEPRPREPEAPFVRTDVAGFIGFESRVVDGTRLSRLTGVPVPGGHEFNVDVARFELDLQDKRGLVPEVINLVLSRDEAGIPINSGQSIIYTIAAGETGSTSLLTASLAGVPAATGREQPPDDEAVGKMMRIVEDGANPCRLTGGPPPQGHEFQVNLAPFYLEVGGRMVQVPLTQNLSLSADPATIPLENGQSLVYSLAVAAVAGPKNLVVIRGLPAATGKQLPPADDRIRALVEARFGRVEWVRIADLRLARQGDVVSFQVPERQWVRLADVKVSRPMPGDYVNLTVIPRLPPATRCDDLNDYLRLFGTPREDGTLLPPAIWAYFVNGGRRCWITTVRRPDFADAGALTEALGEMVGLKGASEREATGLERLLLIDEVSIIDVPDLYARHVGEKPTSMVLSAVSEEACFRDCRDFVVSGPEVARGSVTLGDPLYQDEEVFDTQCRLLRRVLEERWRALLLLNVPLELHPATGSFGGPTATKAKDWRQKLAGLGEDPEKMSASALYFPWVLAQQEIGAPLLELPPTPFVAGVIARRDLARGPQIAPANETLRAAVGLTQPLDDQVHGELYEPPTNINVLRVFPGYGIQVWGARTLSADKWLRYVPVRRALSAIERRAAAALQPLVFEPHTPILWLQVSQLMLSILLPLFNSGALRGSRPEEAFYIRCDSTVNPPQEVETGRLVCEVGVAIAAPAEFIVFRVGRREGVVEVTE